MRAFAALLASITACTAGVPEAGTAAPGAPLPGLTAAERESFTAGGVAFATAHTPAEGLGPLFNDVSCAACHATPATGGGSTRTVARDASGTVIASHVIDGCAAPSSPAAAVSRRATPLFGLGLVDAVPAATLDAVASGQPSDVRGRRGKGRFGWKAQIATLFEFGGRAYLDELGITNPLFPDERWTAPCNPRQDLNDAGEDLAAFSDFLTLLAPVDSPAPSRGADVARSIGCFECHVETLVSGPHPVTALAGRAFHPYGDFLLHDMGALGDGVAQDGAAAREMRTAPLWGLRFAQTLLHDGRTMTIDDAVRAHDGQARRARDAFVALPDADREALVAFLQSL